MLLLIYKIIQMKRSLYVISGEAIVFLESNLEINCKNGTWETTCILLTYTFFNHFSGKVKPWTMRVSNTTPTEIKMTAWGCGKGMTSASVQAMQWQIGSNGIKPTAIPAITNKKTG